MLLKNSVKLAALIGDPLDSLTHGHGNWACTVNQRAFAGLHVGFVRFTHWGPSRCTALDSGELTVARLFELTCRTMYALADSLTNSLQVTQ